MDKHLIKHTKKAIDKTLKQLSHYKPSYDSLSARVLLLGTAMVESSLMYREQIGGGDAKGLWQVEKATYEDNKDNYIRHRPVLEDMIFRLSAEDPFGHDQLMTNDCLACAHGRVWYYRAKAKLPKWNDPVALANYHKQFYNTSGGATDVNESVELFKQAIKEYEND